MKNQNDFEKQNDEHAFTDKISNTIINLVDVVDSIFGDDPKINKPSERNDNH